VTTSTRTTGRYLYRRDGDLMPVDEMFVVTRSPDATRVEVERTAPGTTLSVDATWWGDRSLSFDIGWSAADDSLAPRTDARYEFRDGVLTSSRAFGDAAATVDTVQVDEPLLVFPLMRVFSGRIVAAIAAGPADGSLVLVPDIRDPSDVDGWLRPLVDRRRALAAGDDFVVVDGEPRAARVFDYLGGSYEAAATAYVDGSGLLLRYTWDQPGVGDWDVRVAEIVGPWPEPADW